MDKKQLNKILDWLKSNCKNLGEYVYIESILKEIQEPDFENANKENDYQKRCSIAKLYVKKLEEDNLIEGEWLENSVNIYIITRISPRVLDLKSYPNADKKKMIDNLSWKIIVPVILAIINPIVAIVITKQINDTKENYIIIPESLLKKELFYNSLQDTNDSIEVQVVKYDSINNKFTYELVDK